jgi:hypothetical protein
MNVSTAQALQPNGPAGVPQGEAAPSSTGAAGGADAAVGAPAALPSANPNPYAGLQTAAAYVQVASGYLGRMGDILSRMEAVAQPGSASTGASGPAASAFSQLQTELQAILGGSPGTGGDDASSSSGATFEGSPLFGAQQPAAAIRTGLASLPSVSVGVPGLRQGALLSLVAQDASGGFATSVSSPDVASTLAAASQQVASAADGIGRSQATIDAGSVDALAADDPFQALSSPAGAAAAVHYLAGAILGQGNSAAASISRLSPQSVLGLLAGA